jgi:hypothetical protein
VVFVTVRKEDIRVKNEFRRTLSHTVEQQIYFDLQKDYGFPRAVCRSLVGMFHEYLDLYFGSSRSGNQIVFHATAFDVPPGRPSEEMRTVPVMLTMFDEQDVITTSEEGQTALLHKRILRLTTEAYDQGGLLTQADLAVLLGQGVRTIKRTISDIQEDGAMVYTRGNMRDIGPGISHKTKILELYLKGYEYTDIERRTKHSGMAIMRYVKEFSRFVILKEEGYDRLELRMITDISEKLVDEYDELYKRFNKKKFKDRMDQIRSVGSKKRFTNGRNRPQKAR